MECDICSRKYASDVGFVCIACARSSIYATRLESAKVLLVKEQLAIKVKNIVSLTVEDKEEDDAKTVWKIETKRMHKDDANVRTQETLDHVSILREELEQARKDISARKAYLASRKADLEAVNTRSLSQRSQKVTKVVEVTKRGKQAFNALHDRSVETRAFLCREAAMLLGLKQRKRRKSENVVDQFCLGGLPIVDLKECYNTRCTELNAVLANVAHLLTLVAFYLSLRLPHEIILPQPESPLTTILKADNSYLGCNQSGSGTTTTKIGSNSPTALRHDDGSSLPRPRPLFVGSGDINERVANVYNNDPAAFGLFNEGVSLLALDVAWLCRSQGLYAGTEAWNDASDIGKNLWHLLLAPPQTLIETGEGIPQRAKAGKKTLRTPSAQLKAEFQLGQGSHASAYQFLGSLETSERTSQLPNFAVMTGQLKTKVHADTKNAEWELLREDEWDDGTEQFDEAVHIRTRAMDGHESDEARSIMTTRTRFGDDARPGATLGEVGGRMKTAKTAGTSGWTRVRGREKGTTPKG